MKDKTQLIRQLHACLAANGLLEREIKEDLVYNATKGRSKSTKDMNVKELSDTIQSLNGKAPKVQTPNSESLDKMRKKVISIYREMGMNIFSEPNQKMVADMPKIQESLINNWNKELNDFNADELSKVIGVLNKKFLPSYYAKRATK